MGVIIISTIGHRPASCLLLSITKKAPPQRTIIFGGHFLEKLSSSKKEIPKIVYLSKKELKDLCDKNFARVVKQIEEKNQEIFSHTPSTQSILPKKP